MVFSMEEAKVLIEFFRKHVAHLKRGAKVLLERIDDHESGTHVIGNVVDFSSI